MKAIARDVEALPLDNEGVTPAGDQASALDRLCLVQLAGQKAVDLLFTVSGHGVQKLLTATRTLVEQSSDPSSAIAAWYLEYGKLARVGTAGRRSRKDTIPTAGYSESRRPTTNKALKAARYRRNVTEWRNKPGTVAERHQGLGKNRHPEISAERSRPVPIGQAHNSR